MKKLHGCCFKNRCKSSSTYCPKLIPSLKKICFNKDMVREELKYLTLTVEISTLLLQLFFEVLRSNYMNANKCGESKNKEKTCKQKKQHKNLRGNSLYKSNTYRKSCQLSEVQDSQGWQSCFLNRSCKWN